MNCPIRSSVTCLHGARRGTTTTMMRWAFFFPKQIRNGIFFLKTRMDSSRMRTPLDRDPPLHRDPPSTKTPLNRDPSPRRNMGPETDPPGRNMGPGSQTGSDIIQRPLPPVDRMTDMCKNITFPQTSFVGGKYGQQMVSSGPHISIWNSGSVYT